MTPLYDDATEMSLLGAILRDNGTAKTILDHAVPVDFYSPAHQTIFRETVNIIAVSQKCDINSLTAQASPIVHPAHQPRFPACPPCSSVSQAMSVDQWRYGLLPSFPGVIKL